MYLLHSACNAGDVGDSGDVSSIPATGRCPGGRNGNPFQWVAWQATVQSVTKSWT